jgi:Tfp pilus assembly protein PilP
MTRSLELCCVLVFSLALGASGLSSAQEPLQTPSERTKDAVDKFNNAPSGIGKSLQGLRDAAKERLQQSMGSKKSKTEAKAEPVDLNVPQKLPDSPLPAVTLKEGSRDPFRPMTLRAKVVSRNRENLSPLERLDLGQLKIVGIVWDIKEPRAMVEDTSGLGYTVKVGTPIGSNDGKVKAIHRNQIIIEEISADVYGQRKSRDVSMKLATD